MKDYILLKKAIRVSICPLPTRKKKYRLIHKKKDLDIFMEFKSKKENKKIDKNENY